MLSATVQEHGEVGYFFVENDARVERYDIANEQWLSPLSLSGATGTATVGHVDDDGLYVAYGKAVYRYNLDGSGGTHLLNAPDNAIAIHSDGNLLFINHTAGLYARFISIDKTTNTIVDTFQNYVDSVYGSSIAPSVNRIFGRTSGISPSDITYVSYSDDGQFTGGGDSPYHGDYPGASQTWVFPNDSKVVDNSGTIYATSGLTRLNSFGATVSDVDFLGDDIPIVLSGNTLTAYSAAMLPTGSASLGYTPTEIFVNATDVITFTPDPTLASGFAAQIVPLTQLNPPTPGEPVDPVGLAYTPDKIEWAADGTLLLYSKAQQSIFRWDPVSQSYVGSIPLIGTAEFMAYSSSTNTVYLAYASGLIRQIDLNAAEPLELPFAVLPAGPQGLATAGPYVFAVDPSGAWVSHYTFDPDGSLIEAVEWNYYSKEYVWNDANQKMYFFRDDTSPNDLLWEQINADGVTYSGEPAGGIGTKMDSPLHTSSGFTHPIRVAPDGSVVVLGSGQIHDGTTLARQTMALANSIVDAAWIGAKLFTIRTVGAVAELQQWTTSTYQLLAALQTAGKAQTLMAIPDNRLLAITIPDNGIPNFTIFDENLNVIGPPVVASENAYTLTENGTLAGNVISDDTGAGVDHTSVVGTTMSIVAINGNADSVGTPIELPSGATLTVMSDGSMNYDPRTSQQFNALAAGETFVDSFEYTVAVDSYDSQDSALVDITIEGNDEGFVALINGELIVGGTSAADRILFSSRRNSPDTFVILNGVEFGPFANATRLVAFGGDGNDMIAVLGRVLTSVEFYGGAGDDLLIGSALDDLLSGGPGNDNLHGRGGRDILISGWRDTLRGRRRGMLYGSAANDWLFGDIGDEELDDEVRIDRTLGGLPPPGHRRR